MSLLNTDELSKDLDLSAGPIFVIRADGAVSYRVATQLLALGASVRVSLDNPDLAQEFCAKGAQIFPFDWSKPETFAPALLGIKTVFCTIPHLPDGVEKFVMFTKACRSAGVKNLVKLSFLHAITDAHSGAHSMKSWFERNDTSDPYLKVPLIKMHRECDEHLIKMSFGLNYTLLFASHFMSNPTVYQSEALRKDHCFYGASSGKPVLYVSPTDVAEVAVRCLVQPKKHHNVGYTLVGPECMTDDQVAKQLSDKLGLDIKYVDEDIGKLGQRVSAPDWGPAEDLLYLEDLKATGIEVKEHSNDIAKVCGHPAQTYQEYLQDAQHTMSPLELSYAQQPGLTA